MVEYIKLYIEWVVKRSQSTGEISDAFARRVWDPLEGVRQIARELDRLDPKDFEPTAQAEFVMERGNVALLSRVHSLSDISTIRSVLNPLPELLDRYKGLGSGGATRRFEYLLDTALRSIVERDYAELVVKIYPAGAWKSCVILAGSILEAILFDRLASPAWNTQALASREVPTRKSGGRLPMDDWRLEDLIDIAVDIGSLPKDPANTIHQVLRDYRNFVHPKKEIRAAHACTEAEAMLARGALDSVCNYLESHP